MIGELKEPIQSAKQMMEILGEIAPALKITSIWTLSGLEIATHGIQRNVPGMFQFFGEDTICEFTTF